MRLEDKTIKAEQSIQAIEAAIKVVEEKTYRLAKATMHSACFELERVWDRFFESHDKTIRVSPLVLLAKSKTVK